MNSRDNTEDAIGVFVGSHSSFAVSFTNVEQIFASFDYEDELIRPKFSIAL